MPQVTANQGALLKNPANDAEFKAVFDELEKRAKAKSGSDAGEELAALVNLVRYLAADAAITGF